MLAGLTVLYFAGGKLGLLLAFVNQSASPVWPPTGIALAALLVLGWRVWPAILAGAYLVNLTTTWHTWSSVAIAAGNLFEAMTCAWLVQRFAFGQRAFDRPLGVFRYVLLAGLVGTLISPTIGVTSLALAGEKYAQWSNYGNIWLTWWLGDAGGALVVAPPLVLWWLDPRPGRARSLEAVALLAAVLLVGLLVFGGTLPLDCLCLPVVAWAAFRFGPREAATTVLVLSGLAIHAALRDTGPFAGAGAHQSLLVLQAFLGVIVVTSLSLAAVVTDRHRAQQLLEQHAVVLARSNVELQEFAHIVSHDLKAPLRGIVAVATWLDEDCGQQLPEPAREQLRLVMQRAERMGRLIDGVLAYARAVQVQETPALVDPKTVLDEAILLLAPPRSVSVRIEGSLPLVHYERIKLLQVFQNLVGNAIQHLGKPTGEIIVSARQCDGHVEFLVRDNGVGIDARQFERIFRIFHTLAPESQGTGVGLTIVKKIVELYGGEVAVESTVGAGSTFRFSVPEPAARARDGSRRTG